MVLSRLAKLVCLGSNFTSLMSLRSKSPRLVLTSRTADVDPDRKLAQLSPGCLLVSQAPEPRLLGAEIEIAEQENRRNDPHHQLDLARAAGQRLQPRVGNEAECHAVGD